MKKWVVSLLAVGAIAVSLVGATYGNQVAIDNKEPATSVVTKMALDNKEPTAFVVTNVALDIKEPDTTLIVRA
jgi:hypothetical protein